MSSFFLDKTAFPFGSARESGHIAVGSNPAGAGEAACNNKKALFGFIKSCTVRLTSLMQELLGKSTCFQFIDYPFDNNNKLANSLIFNAFLVLLLGSIKLYRARVLSLLD